MCSYHAVLWSAVLCSAGLSYFLLVCGQVARGDALQGSPQSRGSWRQAEAARLRALHVATSSNSGGGRSTTTSTSGDGDGGGRLVAANAVSAAQQPPQPPEAAATSVSCDPIFHVPVPAIGLDLRDGRLRQQSLPTDCRRRNAAGF